MQRPAFLALALAASLAATPAPAAGEWTADGTPGSFQHEFARLLYHGSLPEAEAHAAAALEAEGQIARFALGTALFLGAVEGLAADLHRYGLEPAEPFGVPFLRLPVPANPSPETLDYAAYRAIFERFAGRLAAARAELALVDDPALLLPLRPGLVRLDIDGDGAHARGERLMPLFAAATGFGPMPGAPVKDIEALLAASAAGDALALTALDALAPPIGFDGADAAWLEGYTHLLAALVETGLAHDWQTSFETSFHAFFPRAGLPMAVLDAELGATGPGDALSAEDRRLGAMVADLLAFGTGAPWPVSEPARLRAAHAHLKAVIATSRRSWAMIGAETDNAAGGPPAAFPEWIPAPGQIQLAGAMPVTTEVLAGWNRFLDAFDRVLDGTLLMPHWRFRRGLNVRRMFEEPRPLSPILLIQGQGALPYLEEGKLADAALADEILRLLGGDFLSYFVWFN